MATFVEILSPGEQRNYVRAASIERIEAPKGLGQTDIASPDEPITLHLRGGQTVLAFSKSPLEILVAMLHGDNIKCAMADGAYGAVD